MALMKELIIEDVKFQLFEYENKALIKIIDLKSNNFTYEFIVNTGEGIVALTKEVRTLNISNREYYLLLLEKRILEDKLEELEKELGIKTKIEEDLINKLNK